ncbi:ABC transporter ATP-binding protein/permease [Mariniblastus sp.]|nr:ABC transporter ATP-binding protein/permease [Mariniblastus sp.]
MKNLGRALRKTLKYRFSLLASFVCSLLVALLWSANLGAVYPFVEVVLTGHSLHDWVDQEAEKSETLIAERQETLDSLHQRIEKLPSDHEAMGSLEHQVASAEYDIAVQNKRSEARQTIVPWIEKYAPDTPFATLAWLMGLMFFATVARGFFLMGSMVSVARVSQRTMLDLQNDVFGNVLDMEAAELGVKGTGDLVSRIRGETGSIGQAISTLYGKTVREPLKLFACLAGAAWVNWRLLLFSLLICPIAGFMMVTLARVTKRANRKAMEESAKLMNRLFQSVTYMRVVRAFTSEDNERERFQTVADTVYQKSMRISIFGALSRINTELLGVSMITLSVMAGGYLVLNETLFMQVFGLDIRMCDAPMSFGRLMLFFGFLIGVADPLRKLANVYNQVQAGAVAADRVFPLIDQKPAIKDPVSPVAIPSGALRVEFDNVRFEYEAGNPILNGVSATIEAGKSMAIIGHNGCGKSTLINLIPRFFDTRPTESGPAGSIKIGGHDVKDYRVKALRQSIGYVTQQTMLFSDTIKNNIAYGSESATQEQIIAAAKKAHAHEFIAALDEGYDTEIGGRSARLSGGQRQRISLARAILKDPEILILDEATSQIDPESDYLIHQTLAEFIKGRTTVVITHRMSTLDLVDQIMLMKDGTVIDCGTHEQLLARCPEYQKMRNLDFVEAA